MLLLGWRGQKCGESGWDTCFLFFFLIFILNRGPGAVAQQQTWKSTIWEHIDPFGNQSRTCSFFFPACSLQVPMVIFVIRLQSRQGLHFSLSEKDVFLVAYSAVTLSILSECEGCQDFRRAWAISPSPCSSRKLSVAALQLLSLQLNLKCSITLAEFQLCH